MCLAALLAVRAGGESAVDKSSAGRYLLCRDGEIRLLPALAKEEMPAGRVRGLAAVGGFVFDIAWCENRIQELKVVSMRGGSCRIRVSPGLFSPVLHKAGRASANPAIRATQAVAPDPAWPPSNFSDAKHFPTECFDFETAPGEVRVMRGTAGRENGVKRVARFSDGFLKTDEARRIAQNVLDYQLASGGWPKNVPMDDPLGARDYANWRKARK